MFLGEVLFHVINAIMWQRCTCAMQCTYVTVTHIHTFMYYSAHEHTFMYSTGKTVDMLHW